MHTPQETDNGLKKEIQHEGEHDGKDDRACHVERRQNAQREQTTEKECLRIGRQRHLRLVGGLRPRGPWLWQMIVGDGRQRGALRWRRGSNHTFSLPDAGMSTWWRMRAADCGTPHEEK